MFIRGSQAYGTNTADSDEDFGGIYIPTIPQLLMGNFPESVENWVDGQGNKVDKSMYSISRFLELAAACNPNILDYMFAPDRCIIKSTELWEYVKSHREKFISKKCKFSFQGYALGQLRRIQTHRGYLLNPVKKPTREEFGLPEESIFPKTQYEVIARLSSEWVKSDLRDEFYNEMAGVIDHEGALVFKKYIATEHHRMAIEDFKRRQKAYLHMLASIKPHFLKDEYVGMAQKELSYITARNNWDAYCEWEKDRNPKRKALEAKIGYDCKHGSHLLRLARMAGEIMKDGQVNVDRTHIDADELKSIRFGEVPFDDLLKLAETANKKAEEYYKTSSLPDEVDRSFLEELTLKMYKLYHGLARLD